MRNTKISKPAMTVKSFITVELIRSKAYEISQSNENTNPVENWLKAEKILKG